MSSTRTKCSLWAVNTTRTVEVDATGPDFVIKQNIRGIDVQTVLLVVVITW